MAVFGLCCDSAGVQRAGAVGCGVIRHGVLVCWTQKPTAWGWVGLAPGGGGAALAGPVLGSFSAFEGGTVLKNLPGVVLGTHQYTVGTGLTTGVVHLVVSCNRA